MPRYYNEQRSVEYIQPNRENIVDRNFAPMVFQYGTEYEMNINILDLNLKCTDSGWPVLRVEYDPDIVSKNNIETAIGEIEDPAGHNYNCLL